MTETEVDRQKSLQIDVQRLLGRCMLRLQQYERLLKDVVALGKVSARSGKPGSVPTMQTTATERKTLGALVGMFTGTHLVDADASVDEDLPAEMKADFTMHWRLKMSAEDIDRVEQDLRELVSLRNDLVHHFIDHHDISSEAGCLGAQAALRAAGKIIEAHLLRLQDWAEVLGQARQALANALASGPVREIFVSAPVGQAGQVQITLTEPEGKAAPKRQ